jgi:hypothetical protein
MDYSQDEKDVLVAGIVGGQERDALWSRRHAAVESLAGRGLLRIGHEMMADGTVSSFPLCLSPSGVLEARRLHEGGRAVWGEIAALAGFGNR